MGPTRFRETNFGPLVWPGGYIATPSGSSGGGASTSEARGQIHAIARSITLDRIGVTVTTAGAAGALARLGIYALNPDDLANATLLLDAGTVAIDSTGQTEITIAQAVTPGWYAFVMVHDDGDAQYQRVLASDATGVALGSYGTSFSSGNVGSGVNVADCTVAGGMDAASPSAGSYPLAPQVFARRVA